ncbi:MAG: hypothetical protein ACTHJT_07195, partial [Cytophaga sp.]|uniref:hypothetical protein n=1 Tax=Cytophaga sp. TaxID=29535 RepID=UPI003F7F852F
MIRNRKWLISFAYFFLFNMLVQIAAPTVAYGLSGNPTTPEFDSFSQESSGMVDGITGDFSYSTPIMELPGPEGSYPINAFYKSGIKTEQDASWVGLGWNINAGAITRNVNGFPDDFSGAGYVVTDTWSGSADTSYSLETPLSTNLSNTSVNTGSAINAKYNLFSIDPTSGTNYAYGALHGVDAVTGTNVVLNRMYDSYAKYDPNINIAANPDPEKQMGGSVPAFDQYSVSGHGISGEIEPAIFDNGTLFRKKVVMGTDTFKTYKIEKNSTVVKPQFRFKKEFSNRFQPIPYDFTLSPSPSYPAGPNGLSYLYSSPDVYNGPDTTVGYNTSLKKLAGARNVEYYTNNEIVSGAAVSAGFVKYQGLADGNRNSIVMTIESGTKTYNVANQVGGFSITNVDGTVYHYALPAYSYSYSKKYTVPSTKTSGRTARVVSFTQAYAYTWLLTSITGSDFIDRNANGYADEGDTGFWTNFTYGKKTDNYIYREPFTGTRNEVDGSYAYSAGRKQVYYLDAIFNRTNSVFFSKGTGRLDAKSATDTLSGGLGANSATVLQLDSVMLYDNAGLKTTLGAATIYAGVTQIQGLNANGFIDGADFTSLNSSYPDNATYKIKTTLFVYDYSLCPQTANSSASTTGRLTLTQIKYNGQYGTQIMPPMTFGYELPSPQSSSSISISGISGRKASISVCFNSNIVTGNILKITSGANTYYATLLNQTASGGGCITYNMIFLGNTYPSANVSGTAVTTKNPPYTADFYDMWGYLKSDYQFAANPALQNNSRRVTATSAASTDAWSLRRITNSLGSIIDITYEPDSYNNVEHGVANMYNIDQVIGYKKRSDNSIHYSSEFTNNAFPIGDPTGDWYQIYFADPDTLGVLNNFAVNDSITLSSISAYLDATRTAPATDTTQYGTANFKVIGKGKDVRGCYLTISYTGKVSNTAMESLNPLRYPYTSTANTVRTIFPTGARTTASHLHKHYGSYVTLNKSYPTQAAASVKYGGGARVQKIRSTEPTTGEYYDKVYSYTDNFNVTTGSLSYEPVGFDG